MRVNFYQLLVWGCLCLLACRPGPAAEAAPTSQSQEAGGQVLLTLTDEGLGLPLRTEIIPAGWEAFAWVQTNLATGYYEVFVRDVHGPQGEWIRDLGPIPYTSLGGHSYPQAVTATITRGLQGELAALRLEGWQPSHFFDPMPWCQAAAPAGRGEGTEILLQGLRAGKPVHGMAYLWHQPATDFPETGTFRLTLVVSSPPQFVHALRINEGIMRSREELPEVPHQQARIRQAVRDRHGRQAAAAELQAIKAAYQAMMATLMPPVVLRDRAGPDQGRDAAATPPARPPDP